jgi:hypothetical protein
MLNELRIYQDPYDALSERLGQLRGLIKKVPPMIEADRQRRWTEIAQRPGSAVDETIDIYETEAGPEEGYGHARYDQVLYSTAIVTAWESFHVYLAHLLERRCLRYDLESHPVLDSLVNDERKRWDRRFDDLVRRYKEFGGLDLKDLGDPWKKVLHAKELRNALVHNLGYYTSAYANLADARWPSDEDEIPYSIPESVDDLINQREIQLNEQFTDEVIVQLLDAARIVADRLHEGA